MQQPQFFPPETFKVPCSHCQWVNFIFWRSLHYCMHSLMRFGIWMGFCRKDLANKGIYSTLWSRQSTKLDKIDIQHLQYFLTISNSSNLTVNPTWGYQNYFQILFVIPMSILHSNLLVIGDTNWRSSLQFTSDCQPVCQVVTWFLQRAVITRLFTLMLNQCPTYSSNVAVSWDVA